MWQAGDEVLIDWADETYPAVILLASPNGKSLMLQFDGIIESHVGMMPVLLNDDTGQYETLTNRAIIVVREQN